jgi:ATP-dependent Lhr-like helicase
LPIIRAVYPDAVVEPPLTAPAAELKKDWERADALRELVRGRMEVSGPLTASALAEFFQVPQAEIDVALLGLEGEGFILRGKFHPGAQELEWCDRRLLARIHRLTINRLRAEIQPVSIAEFLRFLLAWQRVDAEHRAEGPDGVGTILDMLDGYELPAGAWEPEVLALRIKDYDPHWLDQMCFTGRIGWARLSPPANQNGRPFAPVRSSPVSLFARENLHHWVELAPPVGLANFAPDTTLVLEKLSRAGALFFSEIVKQTTLLPSRVEQALAELVAQGWATSDSFEGLRALLLPQEKRAPFANGEHKRRHKTITSVEFAGRWSLLQREGASGQDSEPSAQSGHDVALETFARILLRRYGVVFRRLLDRESLNVTWYELGRVYRRLEARGEIRGGHFVGGVSGEQFALPEAIGMLRSLRKKPGAGELIAISGPDPLNLCGILTPGPRITAIAANRIVLRDGVPVAGLEGGKIVTLEPEAKDLDLAAERTLRIGSLPVALRRYYA